MKILKKMRSDVALAIEPDLRAIALQRSSFNENIRFFVVIGQVFGLMPIDGVLKKNISDLRFRWFSWKMAYSIYNVCGASVAISFILLKFFKFGLAIDELAPFMFYLWNFFAGLQMIQICRNWTSILKEWTLVEVSMRNYGFTYNLRRKFIFITVSVMFLALTEHILFIMNSLYDSSKCPNFKNYSAEIYFGMAFPFYFRIIDFSPAMAIFSEICNILCTVTWNYTDIFIMLICTSLTTRFNQINQKLKYNKIMQERFWKEIRLDYNRLSHLTRVVDKFVSPLVMVSYIDNILFLCIQLYLSLHERRSTIETLYFFWSFGFLVLRTITVTMYGAWLYDATKKPLRYLCSVPSEYYCTEIDRLIKQIAVTEIGITGSRFFILNRTFLLKMAGTMVTFELMIFQFGPVIDQSDKTPIHCIR